VQYAHARIASIQEQARQRGLVVDPSQVQLERLTLREELDLIKEVVRFPEAVESSAAALEPQYLVSYLLELAGEFHRYYNRFRVISEDEALTRARLLLAQCVQEAIGKGLHLLGIAAPLRMEGRQEVGDHPPTEENPGERFAK
jgi:arginyl-tRNA synthetase